MIAKPPTPGFLPDLAMPLRDALRGVATLADATEEMLEPAAKLLPEPLRSRFRTALDSLEAAGKRLIHAPLDIRQIDMAARFMAGSDTGRPALEACATVIAYAWEHLGEARETHGRLISETLVAERLARTRAVSLAGGADFAAEVLIALRQSSAIGRMPGLTRGLSTGDADDVDLAVMAVAIWLLSSRSETLAEEEKLLDLSLALVRALRDDAATAMSGRESLARFLAETSAHL
ncbi:hypothetical protein MAA8898_01302 [Maliponia aquimaris]|uniref:Uncharacterized protein n=2 Tax=Maliponia aquimaris TaxID=1673631 RepID=A0A238K7H2_9RHOB|nr:hypothetical protein MAA8898_01302 [Maliponia aquimaris]